MRSQTFKILLKSEVAVGSPGTVQGGRDTMDYLSGGLFLGAAAAHLYRELGDHAWTVFHSGKVRFSDALPQAPSGLIAFPTPQSLATYKHQKTARNDVFAAKELVNLLFQPRDANFAKVATPYLSAAGEKVRPLAHYRIKTAIDPRSGASMDQRLYGYHSLAADQVFHFRLEADDDLPDALFDKLVAVFNDTVRLGRSRWAEYGRCQITPITSDLPKPTPAKDGSLTLLLCSDLIVEDEGGATPALPQAHHLGLPPAELIAERCFVRHAWRSLYNGKYRAYESDLPIITRGSVLCYRMAPDDLATVLRAPLHYAGLQQQRGFGCLLVNPPFLAEDLKLLAPLSVSSQVASDPQPDHPMAAWLRLRLTTRVADDTARNLAESWYQELKGLYDAARVRGGFTADMIVGPTPSQWGRVAEVVGREVGASPNVKSLNKLLFADQVKNSQKAAVICNAKDPDWSRVIVAPELEDQLKRPPTFADWLEAKLMANPAVTDAETADMSEPMRVQAMAHFARSAADRAKQQRNQQEVNHG